MAAKQIEGLVISEESTMINIALAIVDLAAKHRIALGIKIPELMLLRADKLIK